MNVAGLPWHIMRTMLVAGNCMAESARRATNKREWCWYNLTPPQSRLARKYYTDLSRQLVKSQSRRRRIERGLNVSDKGAFDRYYSRTGAASQSGLQAIMASIVVGAWTSFEALAEEAWVAALNARPMLALVAMDADIRERDDEKEKDRKREVLAPIPIWKTLDSKFKAHRRMGELLRNYGRNWDKRGEAQKSYRKVFRKNYAKIDAIFGSQKLRWTAVLRNAIVHNGGLADEDFVRGMRKHPRLNRIVENNPIPIDGAIAFEMSIAAIGSGMELLDFVNEWINDHPA